MVLGLMLGIAAMLILGLGAASLLAGIGVAPARAPARPTARPGR
jgi:MATE family multidrug resistance protein